MTLAGTRPILQDELLKYELHHRARIAIKPGITGMWQVSGRSDITDFEEVVRLDTEYISNWNFGLQWLTEVGIIGSIPFFFFFISTFRKKQNYMTVPAAIRELEKIEMTRQTDNIYRLDHAVTANQKVILKAFGLDANSIKYFASELSKELKKSE